jgi:hypothetical protein
MRQNQIVVERPKRRDSTIESMASVVGYPSAYAGTTITLKAVEVGVIGCWIAFVINFGVARAKAA